MSDQPASPVRRKSCWAMRVVALLATVAVSAACSPARDEPSATSGSPAASPTPSQDSRVKEASEKALAVYDGYLETWVAVTAVGEDKENSLRKYVGDPALQQMRIGLMKMGQDGIVYRGRPVWNPRVTHVHLDPPPIRVTIEDCFDSTEWHAVFKDTGESAAAPGQAQRYTGTATVMYYDYIDEWLVNEVAVDRSRTC